MLWQSIQTINYISTALAWTQGPFLQKIECKSSVFIFSFFPLYKIIVYTAALYFQHDSWRSHASEFFTCWGSGRGNDRSVPMVTNPRYSCRSAPKQVCWWHHQICHLPRRPCSLPGRQLAEWGHLLALRSLCLRYSRLPDGHVRSAASERRFKHFAST